MGVGYALPAIEQLGAKVEIITSDDLAWGNLLCFDAIVTGVRAFNIARICARIISVCSTTRRTGGR